MSHASSSVTICYSHLFFCRPGSLSLYFSKCLRLLLGLHQNITQWCPRNVTHEFKNFNQYQLHSNQVFLFLSISCASDDLWSRILTFSSVSSILSRGNPAEWEISPWLGQLTPPHRVRRAVCTLNGSDTNGQSSIQAMKSVLNRLSMLLSYK